MRPEGGARPGWALPGGVVKGGVGREKKGEKVKMGVWGDRGRGGAAGGWAPTDRAGLGAGLPAPHSAP